MALTDETYKKWIEFTLSDTTTAIQVQARLNEMANMLTVASVTPSLTGFPTGFSLSSAQTGSADSTHTFDYGNDYNNRYAAMVRITTTIGATPTCTYAIKGSTDNSTFVSLLYADSTTPTTFVSTTFLATTATTVAKIIKPGQNYRYLKLTYSANTNVTNTADIYPLGS